VCVCVYVCMYRARKIKREGGVLEIKWDNIKVKGEGKNLN